MSKALRYGSAIRSRIAPSRLSPFGRLRPFVYPAAVLAAIATLFQPIPAMAAPTDPAVPVSIPDTGSRPTQTGSLVLPGTPSPATTTTVTPVTSVTGIATSPIVQKIEAGRAEVAALGDELIRVGQDRDIVKAQVTTAAQKVIDAQEALRNAQNAAVEAADAAMREAAALPPGATGSGLLDLESLARLQRGDATADQAAARRLETAETTAQLALDEQTTSNTKFADLAEQWTKLSGQLSQKQKAQQKLELDNAAELSAAETTQNAADQALGNEYLAGSEAGRSADARAIQALEYALAQRGDPYVWSEEGPDQFDCSGLMYAAYRGVGYPLVRVSRDQYYQTRDRAVSRYSLLPGDLLFFSSSNSWTGIHHVAMYAGEGMMVEAPRTGLNVRLTPVRWSRLFAATRVYGSIEGDTEAPDLGAPDPDEPGTTSPTTPASPTSPPSSPSSPSSSPPSSPSSTPSKTPSSSPSTTPSKTPSSSPSTTPSKTPSSSPSTTPSKTPSSSPSTTPSTSKSPDPETSATQPQTQPTPEKTTSSPSQVASSNAAASDAASSSAGESSSSASAESVSPSESTSSSAE
ncbi:hypothetical protein ACTI_23360 [Actinoplanes sp. OR16]|uniref:C40 family peptidase n=1 Tax=Actinoplanes sp. OR16 TaxID=946334 RepID=UPI000F6BA6AB|nr:C40 family peptidase [Actinoplanes sp. OR16]BBH65651.1 hypothetical protein ACTI_23360 [Actinoplanes sp. OR16]